MKEGRNHRNVARSDILLFERHHQTTLGQSTQGGTSAFQSNSDRK